MVTRNKRNGARLHVHLAPLAPVDRRRLPVVRAGHAAAGTATACAIVFVRVVRIGHCGRGDVGDEQPLRRWRGRGSARLRRRGDAQRRQQRPAHGHGGHGDRADRHGGVHG